MLYRKRLCSRHEKSHQTPYRQLVADSEGQTQVGVCLALQQLQHVLWNLVGLRHHGRTCLLQDLGAAQAGRFSNGKKYTS